MLSENKRIESVLLENFRKDGSLKAVMKLVENKLHVSRHELLLPKWVVVVGSIGLSLALIFFIATMAVIVAAPRPSLYMESCLRRSCMNDLNLKCYNNTCKCADNQIFIYKCVDKRDYKAHCSISYPCKDNQNLTCRDGICKCNRTSYWNTNKCDFKKGYKQTCYSNEECLTDIALYCDTTLNKCTCDGSRYWDQTACTPKRTINETCTSDDQCIIYQNLKCISGICSCESKSLYWEPLFTSCLTKKYENETCSVTGQCYSPMTCVSGICKCGTFQYHNISSFSCKNQTLNNTKCSVTYNCRVDLGLECVNGTCQCIAEFPFWSKFHTKCILPKTYTETTCYDSTDCYTSNSLICNKDSSYLATPCNCPSTSSVGMCDCKRVSGNEYYWNATSCVPAITNGKPCTGSTESYMCQTLTQGTICNSSTGVFLCECPVNMYFNGTSCQNQVLNNVACPLGIECRSDYGLSCQSGICQCDTSSQFWSINVIPNRCINYFNYTQSCSTSNLCHPLLGLICSTGSSCNCPSTSVTNKCDCNRISGSEYFWNGTSCTPALSITSSCSSSSTNYMCQTLTQGTICNSTSGVFMCQCPPLKYFNGTYCVNQVLNNVVCPLGIECRADYGLICQSGTCLCNATYQFWSTGVTPNRCINYKNYTDACTANGECNYWNGLICKTATNTACNCPSTSSNSKCDCVREFNNETYWNGAACVSALSIGSTCTSLTTNYMCQTLTQGTICNSTSGVFICQCPPLKYYNGSYCVDQVLNNVACPLGIECRADYGLICQSGTCLCNATYQFWSTGVTPNRCINYKNYTDACTANGECNYWNGLICKTATNTACNCPSTSSNSKCDCTREFNNETYWNGTACVSTLAIGSTCSSSSTNYMCKTLTQGTICNSSSGIFKCECPPLKYYNGSYCVDQVLNNVACPLGIECRSDYGLICQSGVCLCNTSYQFWSTTSTPIRCINYRNYTESCAANSDCNTKLGLICKASTNSVCNCPATSANGLCDCPRAVNNETFWNGTNCVPAGAYNTTCTVGNNFECQTLTQNTSCVSGKCLCGTDGGIKASTNMCAYCITGWTFLFDFCYNAGTSTTANTDNSNTGSKTDSGCGLSTSGLGRKAKITNSSVLQLLISKQVSPREYWVDFWKGATDYFSTDGTVSVPPTMWCSGYPDGTNAVYWSSPGACYKSGGNTAGISNYYFCQYTP